MTVNVWPAIVSVPLRAAPEFAATVNVTVPLPAPLAPAVIVSQLVAVVALQAQSAPAVTFTEPDAAAAPNEALIDDNAGAHGAEKTNVFEKSLDVVPPGPIAVTRAWYSTPVGSGEDSRATKSTLIVPSASGAGFPRSTDVDSAPVLAR